MGAALGPELAVVSCSLRCRVRVGVCVCVCAVVCVMCLRSGCGMGAMCGVAMMLMKEPMRAMRAT